MRNSVAKVRRLANAAMGLVSVFIALAAAAQLPTTTAITEAPNESAYNTAHIRVALSSSELPSANATVRLLVDGVDHSGAVYLDRIDDTSNTILYAVYFAPHAGQHTLQAFFDGIPDQFAPSSSAPFPMQVSKAPFPFDSPPGTTSAVFGNPWLACFSSMDFLGSAGDGTVTYSIDGVDAMTLPVDVVEQCAMFTWHDYQTVATHQIQARFNGNADYEPAQSLPATLTVLPAPPGFASGTPSSVPFRSPMKIEINTLPNSRVPDLPLPTGSVQFSVDGSPVGPHVPLDSTGAAKAIVLMTARTQLTIHAAYSGDARYAPSSFDLQPINASPNVTFVTMFSPAAPKYGDAVTATIRIVPLAGVVDVPTGSMTVRVDAGWTTGPLDGKGARSVTFHPRHAGDNQVAAIYEGDANYTPRSSVLPLMLGFQVAPSEAVGKIEVKASRTPDLVHIDVRLNTAPPTSLPVEGSFDVVETSQGSDRVVCASQLMSAGVGQCDAILPSRSHVLVARFRSADVFETTASFDLDAIAPAPLAVPVLSRRIGAALFLMVAVSGALLLLAARGRVTRRRQAS